ncbi:hypothetical protein QR680_004390 [Steinernema hermaphroditum]|uniref:G-protein coupled receptors family 1 profile domain-containing protein n=1 Tax=Steinernema hermaphroditum TaxID=289476 RepID=A0AA39HQR5_9BILA|nr:hypothetical protein QR680_004390 [Steinernema hermaphroditum]
MGQFISLECLLKSSSDASSMEISVYIVVLRSVELVFDFLAPVFNLYFLFILRRKVFHTHLRVILGVFAISLSVMTLTRALDAINELFRLNIPRSIIGVTSFVHNDCMTLVMDISLLLTLERLLATVMATKYEKMQSIISSVVACVLLWLLNTHNTYLMLIWLNSSNVKSDCTIEFGGQSYSTNIIINLSALMTLNVASVTLFIRLRSYNMKRYLHDYKHKLTRRFQISENIRTSRQILYILIINLVVNFYFFFVLYYVAVRKTANQTVIYLAQFFDLFAAIASVLYPSILILSHPRLRLQLRQHFQKLYGASNAAGPSIHSINNQPMVFQTSTQGSVYFQELQKSWNA